MKSDRSKNDLIMLGAVAVLGILAIGMVVAAVMERDIPEALSSLSVGVLGAVAGYVTAGRSKPVEEGTHSESAGPGLGLGVDPGLEGDEGAEFGDEDDDWFEKFMSEPEEKPNG